MFFFAKLFLKFFDKFTQNQIFKFIKSILNNEINVLVDVGSHCGEYINSINKNFDVNKIYGFEPNPKSYRTLLKNTKKIKNLETFNCAADLSEGVAILNINIESSSSSINQLNEKSKYFKRKYFFFNFLKKKNFLKPTKIKTIMLGNFIEKKKLVSIDLLKIDTEGFEYNVIKGLGVNLNKIKLLHLEHHFDDMIIKNYKLTDIHNYLVKNNFKKVFKIKMKFRKSFEYVYQNQTL